MDVNDIDLGSFLGEPYSVSHFWFMVENIENGWNDRKHNPARISQYYKDMFIMASQKVKGNLKGKSNAKTQNQEAMWLNVRLSAEDEAVLSQQDTDGLASFLFILQIVGGGGSATVKHDVAKGTHNAYIFSGFGTDDGALYGVSAFADTAEFALDVLAYKCELVLSRGVDAFTTAGARRFG